MEDLYNYIKKEYDHLKPNLLPKQDSKRIVEKNILLEIYFKNEKGISHTNLAHILKIDRKTLRVYIQPLIEKNLVEREPGKHGKYFPTQNLRQRKDIMAFFLIRASISMFFNEKDFIVNSPYFLFDENDLKQKLETEYFVGNAIFNFSNKIGAIITYLVIESMNPENNIASGESDHDIINIKLKYWLEDAISEFLPILQPLFKEYVYNHLDCLITKSKNKISKKDPHGLTAFVDYLFKTPNTFDKDCIDELHSAFFEIYPNLNRPLNKIKEYYPKWLQKIEQEEKEFLQGKEQQKKCSHNYEYYKRGGTKKILKCKKCNKIKYPY